MKIRGTRLPFTKKSCLFICFLIGMLTFAGFTKEDRQKFRNFKKDFISRFIPQKEETAKAGYENFSGQSQNKDKDLTIRKSSSQNTLPESENTTVGLSDAQNTISVPANTYFSKEKEGTIGVFSDKEEDRISDNFFTIDISGLTGKETKAYLEYDLFGLASHQSVARSINRNIAIGGNMIVPNAQWSHQKEAIGTEQIIKGMNTILFTSPSEGIKYKVKNVKIVFEAGQRLSDLNISTVLSDGRLYIKGNNTSNEHIKINNDEIPVINGEFEKIIQLSEADKAKGSFLIDENGIESSYKFPSESKSFKTFNAEYYKAKDINISEGDELNIAYEGMNLNVEKGTSEAARIELLKLRPKDFPATSQGLKNVTLGNSAYRLSVVSGKLNKKVKLTMPYDEKRLGLVSPKDIKVFYFDYARKQWMIEKASAVDTKTKTVTVEGDGNTDYINGVISVPESPQLNAFAPTSISGLKAGDPMASVQLLNPPVASQKGDANMNYPINVPAGIGGLQPSLSIGYSSGGVNGWMGEGWDVKGVSSITIDTRWGTPQFDTSTETELYSLDGEMLVYPNNYLPHRHNDVSETNTAITTDKQLRTAYAINDVKQFYIRKNHDFSIIERIGDNVSNYSWKITATDGTKSYYGGDANCIIKNASNQIVHWALRKIEDVHGNIMEFTYHNISVNAGNNNNNSNINGGVYFHIKKISYGKDGNYTVNFNTQAGIGRNDININGKQGVKRVEPYLLTNIDVNYKTDIIRSYRI